MCPEITLCAWANGLADPNHLNDRRHFLKEESTVRTTVTFEK